MGGGECPVKERPMEVHSVKDLQPMLMQIIYNKENKKVDELFGKFETQTGLKREQLTYGILGLLAVYLIVGKFAELLCNLIGFAYPAYASVKAIRTSTKDDDTQWLVYWTVFAFFSLIDFFAEVIMDVVPLYWLAKTIFLIFLAMPQTSGAQNIYVWYVDPMVTKLEKSLSAISGGR